jgi:uncharacterized protein DUF2834
MSVLRMIYLGFAVLGTLLPMMAYLPWMQETGAGPLALIAAWKANGATTGLYYDLLISAFALNTWIVAETYIRKDYWVLICIPVIYLIGVSAALPLFLFLRTRPVT